MVIFCLASGGAWGKERREQGKCNAQQSASCVPGGLRICARGLQLGPAVVLWHFHDMGWIRVHVTHAVISSCGCTRNWNTSLLLFQQNTALGRGKDWMVCLWSVKAFYLCSPGMLEELLKLHICLVALSKKVALCGALGLAVGHSVILTGQACLCRFGSEL